MSSIGDLQVTLECKVEDQNKVMGVVKLKGSRRI